MTKDETNNKQDQQKMQRNTGKDKTRLLKITQENTTQGNTTQNKTRQPKTRQDKIR